MYLLCNKSPEKVRARKSPFLKLENEVESWKLKVATFTCNLCAVANKRKKVGDKFHPKSRQVFTEMQQNKQNFKFRTNSAIHKPKLTLGKTWNWNSLMQESYAIKIFFLVCKQQTKKFSKLVKQTFDWSKSLLLLLKLYFTFSSWPLSNLTQPLATTLVIQPTPTMLQKK